MFAFNRLKSEWYDFHDPIIIDTLCYNPVEASHRIVSPTVSRDIDPPYPLIN